MKQLYVIGPQAEDIKEPFSGGFGLLNSLVADARNNRQAYLQQSYMQALTSADKVKIFTDKQQAYDYIFTTVKPKPSKLRGNHDFLVDIHSAVFHGMPIYVIQMSEEQYQSFIGKHDLVKKDASTYLVGSFGNDGNITTGDMNYYEVKLNELQDVSVERVTFTPLLPDPEGHYSGHNGALTIYQYPKQPGSVEQTKDRPDLVGRADTVFDNAILNSSEDLSAVPDKNVATPVSKTMT